MISIRDRLLKTEDDFLSAVVDGDSAIETFSLRWTTLREDITAAVAQTSLDEDTLCLVHDVFSRMELLASSFCDIFVASEDIHASMDSELADVFAHLTLSDVETKNSVTAHVEDFAPPMYGDVESFDADLYFDIEDFLPSSPEPSLVSDYSSSDCSDDDDLPSPVIGKRGTEGRGEECCKRHMRKRPRSSYRSPEDTPDVSPTSWLWDEPDEHCVSQDSAPHEAISTVRTIRPLPPRKNFVTSDGVIARPLALQRKRRLSDAEVQPLPKRPRGCGAVARGQTVSNPLPRRGNELEEQTHNIDDWFTTFAVVEPATFEPPERRASMVIEVFTGFRGSTTRVYNKPVTSQSAAVDSSSTECSQQSAISAITPRASISMACGADGAVSSTSTNAVDVEPSHTQEEAISAHPSQDPTPLSATPSTTSFLLDGPVPPKLEMCDSPVTAAVSLTSDVSDLARSLSGISHEIVHRPDELSSNSVISQSVAPVSRDRSPTPPPSFESATTSPACDPPGYSVLDLFPPTGSLTPPPPYRHSPEKELPLILPINDKPLDAGALLAELLPLVLSGTVREYPEASPQHVQVPWAGLAISV